MTTLIDARKAMYQEYFDNATEITVATQLTFENEKYDPPADSLWVRFAVRHFGGGQGSLGSSDRANRKWDRRGAIFLQIFSPQDDGMENTDDVANEARTILEGKTLTPENIHLYDAEVREIGLLDGYQQTNVEIPFFYQQTR